MSSRATFLVPGLAAFVLLASACGSRSDGAPQGHATTGGRGGTGAGGGSLGDVAGGSAAGQAGHAGGAGAAGGELGLMAGSRGGAADTNTAGLGGSGGAGGNAGGSGAGGSGGGISHALSFAAAASYAVRTPQVVTLADFNHDGRLDAATVSFSGEATVLLGKENGAFQADRTYPATGVVPGTAIVAADFNRDGHPDLAFSMERYGFGTLLGNGDGTFQRFVYRGAGNTRGGLAVADLNDDGHLDVVMPFPRVLGDVTGAVVALGAGDGGFQAARAAYAAPGVYGGVALIDVDKDGKVDIVTSGGGFVSVLLGKGDGTFPFTGTDFPVASGTFISSMAAGDLNGDGAQDVVAPDSASALVNVVLGKGDGTFLAANTFPCGPNATDVKLADLNGDGLLDMVATNDNGPGKPGTVAVLTGKGDGAFNAYLTFATGMGPHAVSIGDVDGDARPDLVVANKDDDSVSVLLNTSR